MIMKDHIWLDTTQKSIKTLRGRAKAFKLSFFPFCVKEWGNLSGELRNIDSIKKFKLSILNFVRPREYSVFPVHDINDLKLLTRSRLNFSHLNEHKFRHNFNDTINPMSSCRKEPETTLHYLLHSDFYSIYRIELLNDICALTNFLKNIVEENLLKLLLYGAEECSSKINSEILKCTIKFIKKKKKQITLVVHYLFLHFFPLTLTKYLIFFYVFYVQSKYRIYITRYIYYVNFVSCIFLFNYFYF